jgi:hypothetical protein
MGPNQSTALPRRKCQESEAAHFHKMETTRNHPHQNVWKLRHKSQLSTRYKLLIYKTILKPIWTWSTTLRYGFHFQHRNPRTFPIESFVHDKERTLVCAEHSHPKVPPITNLPLQL